MDQSAEAGWCVGCKSTRTSTGSVKRVRSSRFHCDKICTKCEIRLKREARAAAGRRKATAGISVVGHGAATGCAPKVGRPVLAPLSVNKQASNTPIKVTTSLQTPRATAEADISGAVGLPAGGFARPPISASRLQHSLLSVHHASNHELGGVGRLYTPAKVPTLVASQHSPQTPVAMRRPSFGRDVAGKTQVSNVAPLAGAHAAHETLERSVL